MIQFLGRIAPRERKRMSSQLLDGSDGRWRKWRVGFGLRKRTDRPFRAGNPKSSDHCDAHLCRGPTFSIDCQRACVNNAIFADIWRFAKMLFHRAYTRMIS